MDFSIPADNRVKIKESKKTKTGHILGSCLRAEKVVEHEGDSDTNHSRNPWNSLEELEKETGWTGEQMKNPDNSIPKIK